METLVWMMLGAIILGVVVWLWLASHVDDLDNWR